jgi:hypothetical protein
MEKMYRIAFLALIGTAAFAQTEAPQEKPPAGVEQAVIERVNELFTMFTKHDYRKAEGWIAEDTKDYYYSGTKPDVHKFEVLSVEFSEQFSHAKVMVRCTEPVVVAGFPPGEMTVVNPTLWKLEDGKWVYYEDPNKIHNPGGLEGKIKAAVDQAASGNLTPPEVALRDLPKDPSFVLGKLVVDRQEITITAGTEEKILIANGLPGPVSLEPGTPLPGIEATLDRHDISRGEKATLTLKAGKEPAGGFYYLRIMPTGEALRIKVDVR